MIHSEALVDRDTHAIAHLQAALGNQHDAIANAAILHTPES